MKTIAVGPLRDAEDWVTGGMTLAIERRWAGTCHAEGSAAYLRGEEVEPEIEERADLERRVPGVRMAIAKRRVVRNREGEGEWSGGYDMCTALL